MKKYLQILFITILSSTTSIAQQASRYAQSADEFGTDNPAGLSIEEMRYRGTVVHLLVRNQWWNFSTPGYPQAQALTWLDNASERHQMGATVLSDKIGETRQTGFSGRYAIRLAKGLKVGVSVGLLSHRVSIENLDQFDEGDPLAATVGNARLRLHSGIGAFYSFYDRNAAWNWFAGLSFRHVNFLDETQGSGKAQAEDDLLAQGGFGRGSVWVSGRLRLSLNQPTALDAYIRNYFLDERFFLGAMASSDASHYAVGAQFGYERLLSSAGQWNNHFLTLSAGLSKPLSKYVQGGSLIFDFKGTWSWQRRSS